jgi:hypothetical protein
MTELREPMRLFSIGPVRHLVRNRITEIAHLHSADELSINAIAALFQCRCRSMLREGGRVNWTGRPAARTEIVASTCGAAGPEVMDACSCELDAGELA